METKEKAGKKVRRTLRTNRRSEIYKKALDLFVNKGYDATSMSMIAKELGMSKANIYHYFSSKEDILYQLHLDDLQLQPFEGASHWLMIDQSDAFYGFLYSLISSK